MKKILSSLALGVILASSVANADFIRVEAGAGTWAQTPSGYADGTGILNLNGKYTSAEKEKTGAYAWIFIKDPLPIIPDLRLEYASISDEGTTMVTVNNQSLSTEGAPTTVDMNQYDIIPYYNLLDNTFWMTIDAGIDLKVIQSDSTIGALKQNGVTIYKGDSSSNTTVVPLVYLRSRVQIPTTNLGIEAEGKAITDGTDTMYDVQAKVDYTFDFVPVIRPAIEIGYRMQKLRVNDGSNQIDLTYRGPYMGLMARF